MLSWCYDSNKGPAELISLLLLDVYVTCYEATELLIFSSIRGG
jgi:hypothetical protein